MSDPKVDYADYLARTAGDAIHYKAPEPSRSPKPPYPPRQPRQPVEPVDPSPPASRHRDWFPKVTFDRRNLVLAALALVILWDHVGALIPSRRQDNQAVQAGRNWRQPLCDAYRDGFLAAADAIHAGKTISEADTLLKSTADRARQDSFYRVCSPVLAAIVPEPGSDSKSSQEPTHDQLMRFEQAMRDLSAGIGEKPGWLGN